ncbi:MAG: hypothetical protein WBN75_16370 [Verrucomicrobiia bacterium]
MADIDVESLINGLYSRVVVEIFPISDTSRVTVQNVHWSHTRIFLKLKYVPVANSIQAIEQSHPGLIRGLLGLIVGSPYAKEISLGVGNNKNIAFFFARCSMGFAGISPKCSLHSKIHKNGARNKFV